MDLGKTYTLTGLTLDAFYEERHPRAWEVRTSQDGTTWSEHLATGKGHGMLTAITFEPVQARAFKITQLGNAIERWQMTEVWVHGKPLKP